MNEQDDTRAAPSDEPETVVVDSHTISVDHAELAWSLDDEPVESQRQPWRSVWGIVGVIAACSVVAAGVIGLVVWLVSRSGHDVPPPKPSAAPTVSSSVAAPAPTSTVPPVTTVTVKPAPPPSVTAAPPPAPLPTATTTLGPPTFTLAQDHQLVRRLRLNSSSAYPDLANTSDGLLIHYAHEVCLWDWQAGDRYDPDQIEQRIQTEMGWDRWSAVALAMETTSAYDECVGTP
jgi:hypothetical protein